MNDLTKSVTIPCGVSNVTIREEVYRNLTMCVSRRLK